MKRYIVTAFAFASVLGLFSTSGASPAAAAEECVHVAIGEPSRWVFSGTPECRREQVILQDGFVLATIPGVPVGGLECVHVSAGEPSKFESENCTREKEGGGFVLIVPDRWLSAQWLDNGSAITTAQLVDVEGEITLTDQTVLAKIKTQCSVVFDGTLKSNGEGELTELLSLSGTSINSSPLVETGLTCTNVENCPEPLVWADNLPWEMGLAVLDEGTESFFANSLSNKNENAGYHVACMGASIADLCTAPGSIAKITNTGEGEDQEFSEAFSLLAGVGKMNCELGGKEQGTIEGLSFILLAAGGTLAASEA
jgi:hypothetical protein